MDTGTGTGTGMAPKRRSNLQAWFPLRNHLNSLCALCEVFVRKRVHQNLI